MYRDNRSILRPCKNQRFPPNQNVPSPQFNGHLVPNQNGLTAPPWMGHVRHRSTCPTLSELLVSGPESDIQALTRNLSDLTGFYSLIDGITQLEQAVTPVEPSPNS